MSQEYFKIFGQRVEELLENISDAFFALDNQWRFTWLNKEAERLLLKERTELIGKGLLDLFPAIKYSGFYRAYVRAMTGGEAAQVEEYFEPLKRWYSVKVYPTSAGILVFFLDITNKKDIENYTAESELKYKLLFNNSSDGAFLHKICRLEGSGKFIEVNEAACRTLGYSREELLQMSPVDLRDLEEIVDEKKINGNLWEDRWSTFERNLVTKDGTKIPFELNSHLFEMKGETVVLSLARNISERRKVLRALKESEERHRSLFEHNPFPVYSLDINGILCSINKACTETTGYTEEEVLGKSFIPFIYQHDLEKATYSFSKSLQGEPYNFELSIIHKNGSTIDVAITQIPMVVQGEIIGIYGIMQDITKRKHDEAVILELAYYDSLTGLPNRTLFNNRLAEVLGEAEKKAEKFGVLFLDLDRFKNINDTYGHTLGDQLLVEAARRLLNCVGGEALVSRMGGDEFAIILESACKSQVTKLAREIIDVFTDDFTIQGYQLHVTPSIGFALYPKDGLEGETLLKHADIAMYTAKGLGGNSFEGFHRTENSKLFKRMTLESGLRDALKENQFRVYYQPLINIYSGEVIGMEALVRWKHPKKGLIMPGEFIALAEETGLILPIGEWVLRTACKQNLHWHQKGIKQIPVSVNISVYQLRQGNFVELVKKILQETRLDPCWLCLEVTESIFINNFQAITKTLTELKELGVKIALDDFGTGFSSLNVLRHNPIDILKIDRSFIANINSDAKSGPIVSAVITLAKNLGLELVAEGVETKAQRAYLSAKGCENMQGFLFSCPVNGKEFEKIVAKQIG